MFDGKSGSCTRDERSVVLLECLVGLSAQETCSLVIKFNLYVGYCNFFFLEVYLTDKIKAFMRIKRIDYSIVW